MKEALKLALEFIENSECGTADLEARIKEALAQPDRITALRQKTESHDVDCLCSDCIALDDLDEALAQPEQEPVAWMYQDKSTHQVSFQKHMKAFVDHSKTSEVPLYGKPLANHELQCVCGAVWCGDEMVHLPNKTPPQPKQDKERCVGCEACIDTACGRDECPKGWPKAAQPEQEPVAWVPYLSDRADGVKGRYAIARWNPRGYREVWNLRRHEWGAYSDDVLSLEEAGTLLRLITIPTRKVTSPQPPQPKEPEQEPVAWMYPDAFCDKACLYLCTKGFTQFPECATPPQRTWVGLTDEEIRKTCVNIHGGYEQARAIEAKLKEKNA